MRTAVRGERKPLAIVDSELEGGFGGHGAGGKCQNHPKKSPHKLSTSILKAGKNCRKEYCIQRFGQPWVWHAATHGNSFSANLGNRLELRTYGRQNGSWQMRRSGRRRIGLYLDGRQPIKS